jgi:molecular chaperone DnaK (HSP70)
MTSTAMMKAVRPSGVTHQAVGAAMNAPPLPASLGADLDVGPPAHVPVPQNVSALLIDVTPLSLRVETVGSYSDVLIDANSPIPCDRTRAFSTAQDNQTTVYIRVAQGEERVFKDNTFLGELELAGIAELPRGEAEIQVTFALDADGILNVRARDAKSGAVAEARMHVRGRQEADQDVAAMMIRQAVQDIR